MQDECPASECSHFCEDLRRLGYDKMVVDPAVRVGYEYEVALVLDKGKWQTFVPWSEAKRRPPDWDSVPKQPNMMRCPAPRIESCYRRSIYDFKNTGVALHNAAAAVTAGSMQHA